MHPPNHSYILPWPNWDKDRYLRRRHLGRPGCPEKHLIHQSRYLIAAVVGLATGLLTARHTTLGAEFRVDKLVVE